MKKVKKFAWFPTNVITKFEDNIMIFESIWFKSYFQYYEQRLTCDYDPSMDGDIFYKDFPTVKKLY